MQTVDDLAEALIRAHDGGPLIATVPAHLVPPDMAAVHALQDLILGKIGPLGGWKVMAGGEGEPLCAPIPANRYFAEGEPLDAGRHRLILVELEVAVRLGRDLPAAASLPMVEAAIEAVLPALELIGNPFVDRDAMDFNTKLGDLQSNGAVVVGAPFATDLRANVGTLPAALTHDGELVKSGQGGADWSQILAAMQWLATHAAGRGLPLTKGQVIITGSRVLAPMGEARAILGQFGEHGMVQLRLD